MDRRVSTAATTHHGSGMVIGADSSHAAHIHGQSTGAIFEAFGVDTNITAHFRAKGTAQTRIGSTTSPVVIGAPSGTMSTTPIQGMQRYRVDWTVPAMSSGSTAAETTVTVSGLTTNSLLFMSPRVQVNSTVIGITLHPRCSTADELVLQQSKIGEAAISGSTQSAYLFQIDF